VGSGYLGDWSTTYDYSFNTRSARFLVMDALQANSGSNLFSTSSRYQELNATLYAINNTGSRVTDNTQISAARGEVYLFGPNAWGNTANNGTFVNNYSGILASARVGDGNTSANVVAVTGSLSSVSIQANGNANIGVSYLSAMTNFGTMGTWVGYGFNATAGGTMTAPGNVYLIHNPGTNFNNQVTSAQYKITDEIRAATQYWFIRNDDNVSQVRLGSLRRYHEFRLGLASSGNVTINCNSGQVQHIAPSGAVTVDAITNAVVTASDSVNTDQQVSTVTLIIEQGATGYNVTLPSTSGTDIYRYVSGANTVANTANSTSIVTWKIYQNADGNTVYNGRVDTYV
jgi:hypothetical protein